MISHEKLMILSSSSGLTIVVLLFKDKECRQLNPQGPPRLKGNFLPLLFDSKSKQTFF